MSFWDLSGGETAADTGTEYEIPGGGNFDPIPDNSDVLALIDEAKWDKKGEAEFVSLRWSILAPDEYKNRKVFHKLWVTDDDPNAKDSDAAVKKRDKARRMLAAIDANAGGKLTAQSGKPSDDSLALHLCNKPMIIKLRIWELTDSASGELKIGNWVCACMPKSHGVNVSDAPPPKAQTQSQTGQQHRDMDDEIPF